MARQVKAVSATSVQNVGKHSLSTFDTLYFRRQVSEEDVRIVLQSHAEGSSLRGEMSSDSESYAKDLISCFQYPDC